jgi:hypothetical protein
MIILPSQLFSDLYSLENIHFDKFSPPKWSIKLYFMKIIRNALSEAIASGRV